MGRTGRTGPAIEVFEPGNEEEHIAFAVLGMAKQIHENHAAGAAPMAFIFGADHDLSILSLGMFGDLSDSAVKDLAAAQIRRVAAEEHAYFVAVLSDASYTSFANNLSEIEAAGLDIQQHRNWPPEALARFPPTRRETLLLTMESRQGYKLIQQYYRRARGRILWEEVDVIPAASHYVGRLTHLLPKES